jgi:hypothetical protein
VLVALALLLLARGRPRTAGLGGVLSGLAATWLFFLGRTKLECDALNATAGQTCIAPGIDGYLLVAVAILVTGLGLTALALRSARRA